MMAFKKLTQFAVASGLGLLAVMSSYPAYSQNSPSFDDCFKDVKNYPRKAKLNQYTERQVYCLVVVELIEGGVKVDQDYHAAELFGVMMHALRDRNDMDDDRLSYQHIIQAFPGGQLNRLINESIHEAVKEFSVSEMPALQVASAITFDTSQLLVAFGQKSRRARGGTTVMVLSRNVSRSNPRAFLTDDNQGANLGHLTFRD